MTKSIKSVSSCWTAKFASDVNDPNTRQGWMMTFAAIMVVMQGGFLFLAHHQSQQGSWQLHQDMLQFQMKQRQAVETSKNVLMQFSNKSISVTESELDNPSLSTLLMLGGGGILSAQDEMATTRLQKLLQQELVPLYERQEKATEKIRGALEHTSKEMQNLFLLQSSSNVEEELRRQQQVDRVVPIFIAVLIIVGGWIMERRLKNDWKDTLEVLKEREQNIKTDLEETQKSNAQLEKENENLKQLLETSRESVPYSLFEKLQNLETSTKKWETDYKQIKTENKRLKEYTDVQRWEKELKRLQQENQTLREFSGPTELADMRREYAKVKSELKDMELQNMKLHGEVKRLKIDKDKKIKAKQRWSFKSL
jgi:DNA repair exonuclease SbcCD ATPase subunit